VESDTVNDKLKLSRDRKVAPLGIYQPSRRRWLATIHNSFGLPSGTSCPGATEFCRSCYASRSEQSAGVRAAVEYNLRVLQAAGTVDAMTGLLDEMIGRFDRAATRAALPPELRLFRIHWDGDFFSVDYARAWATVIDRHRDIQFWAYTRSFRPPVDVVAEFVGLPNLALYLSVDAENAPDAEAVRARHPGVRLALCAVDYSTARALVPGHDAVACPENNRRLSLMDDGVGACVTCRLCPDDRRDVMFATSHRESAAVPVPLPVRANAAIVAPERPCAHPDCSNTLPPHPTGRRGRVPSYCSRSCQTSAYQLRQRQVS